MLNCTQCNKLKENDTKTTVKLSICILCYNGNRRKRYIRNRKTEAAANKIRYYENRVKYLEKARIYRQTHKEQIATYNKTSKRKKSNKKHQKNYIEKNREAFRIYLALKRVIKRECNQN